MNSDFIITKIARIVFVDKFEYQERKTTFTHDAKCNELIFTFSGQKTVRFNGIELQDRPNSIRFIPPGPVFEYTVERHQPGPCIDIFFYTDRPVSDVSFVFDGGENSKLASMFQNIFSVWVSKREGYQFTCMSLLYSILSQMFHQTYISESQDRHIKAVADYINTNFLTEQITAQKMESISQLSYSHMKRLFVARYGLPPKKYIIRLKLNYACDLLRSGLYTVTEVAEMCGFRDIYFFSRQFKEHIGLAPSQFTKKYRSSK